MSLLLVPGRHCCAQPVSAEKCRVGVEWGHQVWGHQEGQKRGCKKVLRAPRSTGHQQTPIHLHAASEDTWVRE